MATANPLQTLHPAARLEPAPPACPSGHAALDARLGGGWPPGLTELLLERPGGELSLLGDTLARLSRAGRWLVWVAPPFPPYAPALARCGVALQRLLLVGAGQPANADHLWAAEQALAAGSCGAVLLWPGRVRYQQLRRLQLAAAKRRTLGFIFRPPQAAVEPSPAPLRLRLTACRQGLRVEPLKLQVRSCCG